MSRLASIALWGPEHQELGETATASLGRAVAIALDRGRHPKAYHHTDPNEDVVAAVVAGDRTLLVVADGHNGQESSTVAVDAVLRWAGAGLPTTLARDDAVTLVHEVNEQVLAVIGAPGSRNPDSRTTLAVVLVARGRCWWASMGDSAVFVGSAEAVRRLGRDRARYLGWPMHRSQVRLAMQHGCHGLTEAESVVVCTDGLHEFTGGRAARAVVRSALREPDPVDVATAVVDAAGDAGAGDNIAVAVWHRS